jgi:hypothetical protein
MRVVARRGPGADRRARRGAVAHTRTPAPRRTRLEAESFPAQRRRRPAQSRSRRRIRLPRPMHARRARTQRCHGWTRSTWLASRPRARGCRCPAASAYLEHVWRQAPYFRGKQAQQLARDDQRVAIRQHCDDTARRVRPRSRYARARRVRTVLNKRLAAVRRVRGQRSGQRLRVLLDLQLLVRQRCDGEAL